MYRKQGTTNDSASAVSSPTLPPKGGAVRKHMNVFVGLIAIIALVFGGTAATVAFAPPASASTTLGNVLPSGIGHTASVVKHNAQMLVANDYGIQQALASDNGLTTGQVAHSKVASAKKGKCKLGTDGCVNTGRSSDGAIVKTSYHNGTLVATWSVGLSISKTKTITVRFMQVCANPTLHEHGHKPPVIPVTKVAHITIKYHKSVTTHKTITCPSGQKVGVTVTTTVKGWTKTTSIVKGVKIISIRLTSQVKIDVTTKIKVTCGHYPARQPILLLGANGCVQAGQSNGALPVSVGNPNLKTIPLWLYIDGKLVVKTSIKAGKSYDKTFTGYKPGKHTVTAKFPTVKLTTSKTVTIKQCPPPAESISITSFTQLNLIAAGKNSGEFSLTANASKAGGSLTVDPGIGAVSDCNGGSLQDSMTFSSLTAGNNAFCVLIWAPNDADQPPSMTATFTATLGSAKDVKSETFQIQYPTRA